MTKRVEEADPMLCGLYLFVARHRKRAKTLSRDGTGLCLCAKRLKNGHFANLWASGDTTTLDAGGRQKTAGAGAPAVQGGREPAIGPRRIELVYEPQNLRPTDTPIVLGRIRAKP